MELADRLIAWFCELRDTFARNAGLISFPCLASVSGTCVFSDTAAFVTSVQADSISSRGQGKLARNVHVRAKDKGPDSPGNEPNG